MCVGKRKVKFNTTTQNMQISAKMLARLHRYGEWEDVHRELSVREEQERKVSGCPHSTLVYPRGLRAADLGWV